MVKKPNHVQLSYKKSTLPEKICVVCKLPFAWRKKWAKDWPNVLYCSDRCRKQGVK